MRALRHRFAAIAAPAVLLAASLLTGCTGKVVQSAQPPTLYTQPPANALPAKFRGQDVYVILSRSRERPARGWLLVRRFPEDVHATVVAAFPYATYSDYLGVVRTVYATEFEQRSLVSAGTLPDDTRALR